MATTTEKGQLNLVTDGANIIINLETSTVCYVDSFKDGDGVATTVADGAASTDEQPGNCLVRWTA